MQAGDRKVWFGGDSAMAVIGDEPERGATWRPGFRPPPQRSTALAERRLSKLLKRAYAHAQGSRSTLRMSIRVQAREMLAAGCSAAEVVATFERCILDHASCQASNPRSIMTGKLESDTLVDLMQEWVAAVVAEPIP